MRNYQSRNRGLTKHEYSLEGVSCWTLNIAVGVNTSEV